MSLYYKYWNTGYPGIYFSDNPSNIISPAQCFAIYGEQREIHAYLEALGTIPSADFQMIYEFESSSKNTSVGFSDAMVHLFFCTGPFATVNKSDFENKFYTPYRHMFI